MPSFDVVSKVDEHELSNAIDQAGREITTRFDFKGIDASFELEKAKEKEMIVMKAPSDFQLQQMADILSSKLSKRGIDVSALDYKDPDVQLHQARQEVAVQQGLDTPIAKKIVKFIKDKKLKVQTSIQGDQVRVTGKKRDDLQTAIAELKEESFGQPLQFENFRD